MPTQPALTRADIVKRVDIPKDVWTFWMRGGVLRSMEAARGTGNHHKFAWYEANIAAIMNQLRILGVKIEGMLSIGRVYRDAVDYFEGFGLNRDQVNALWSFYNLRSIYVEKRIERSRIIDIVNSPGFDRDGNPQLVAVAECTDEENDEYWLERFKGLGDEKHGAQVLTRELAELCERIKVKDFYHHLDAYLTVTEQPEPGDPGLGTAHPDEMTYFWRIGEGEEYRFAWGTNATAKLREDGAVAMIAIDVTSVLFKVWHPEAAASRDEAAPK